MTQASYDELIARWTDNGTSTQNDREGLADVMKAAYAKEAQSVPVPETPEMQNGGIDLAKYSGKLEAEFCRPTSGDFSSYNITTGRETVDGKAIKYVQWDAKDWGNAKWIVYFEQLGTYDVTARMKVTQRGGANFKFGIGTAITGDGK